MCLKAQVDLVCIFKYDIVTIIVLPVFVFILRISDIFEWRLYFVLTFFKIYYFAAEGAEFYEIDHDKKYYTKEKLEIRFL